MLSRRNFIIQSFTTALGTIGASSVYDQSVQATENQISESKTLFIDCNLFNNQLIIHAELESKYYRYQLKSKADYIINNLEKIYFYLELMSSSKFAIINRIQWLGEEILSPLDKFIQDCQGINFIIPEKLVKCPFDLLHYRRKPLFLQKPVIYSFSKVNSRFNFSEDWSGLIVSDPTTDPDNGAAIVQEILNDSVYYDIQELTLEEFSLIQPQDLVFISAHGLVYVNYNEQQDYIRLVNEGRRKKEEGRRNPILLVSVPSLGQHSLGD